MEDTPIAERRVPRATILIAQSSLDNHELFTMKELTNTQWT